MQYNTIKYTIVGESVSGTQVERDCADESSGIETCATTEVEFPLIDGTKAKTKVYECLCSHDLCNDGEKLQPKLKLLMITMTTALMSMVFI